MAHRKRRRSPSEIERDRRRIANLYLQGRLQAEIAEEVGLAQSTISRDLMALQKQWRESALIDIDAAKAKELARVDRLEREYWDAWERSKEDKETVTKEKTEGEKAGRAKVQMRSEGQAGHSAFLSGIQWCIERRCKLLGLDAPQKQEISGPEGSPIVATNTIIVREYVKENEGD